MYIRLSLRGQGVVCYMPVTYVRSQYYLSTEFIKQFPMGSTHTVEDFRLEISKVLTGYKKRVDEYLHKMVAWKLIDLKDDVVTVVRHD